MDMHQGFIMILPSKYKISGGYFKHSLNSCRFEQMKLLSFIDQVVETAGMLLGPCVYVILELCDSLPQDMMGILEGGEAIMDRLRVIEREISQEVPETNTVASARIRSAQRALDAVQ